MVFKLLEKSMVIHKIELNKSLVWFSVLFSVCLVIAPSGVMAATLYLIPQSQTVYQGDSFIAEIRLDTENKEINTVKVDLKFPSNLLEVVDINKGGSILTLWPQEPAVSNGELSFIGGVPGGFKGDGIIGKIIFQGKEISKPKVNFEETCRVLLNDGKGTADSLSFLGASYEIIKKSEFLPEISSNSHPDQNKWFKSNTLHFHWDLIEGVQYSYLLSQDPLAEPDDIPDKPKGELIWMGDMEYKGLEDGIYYFFLRECAELRERSQTVNYRAMIDTTPPEEFSLEIGQEPALFEGKYFLSFATTDKTSGIDYYEIKEGKGGFKKAQSPYLIKDQSLTKKIIVRVYDKAGNETTVEYLSLEAKKPFPWWVIILIVIGLAAVRWIITKRRK